jgi:cobalt/nickel transport system ATP-binding protein
MTSTDFSKVGLFLIGHGSKDQEAITQFWNLVSLLKSELINSEKTDLNKLKVGAGLIEFATPNLDTGIDDLIHETVDTVVAIPLVLLGAGHLKDDGPIALAKARLRYPNTVFKYANAVGIHHKILEAFATKIKTALGNTASNTGILLVSRGSTDPDANSDLYKVSRLLMERSDIPDLIQPAFVSLAEPNVTTGLKRLSSLGAKQIVVVPYFLFTGILLKRIYEQCDEWSKSTKTEVFCTNELGSHRSILEIIQERFHEAYFDHAHMNCDMCIHRWPIPGFESKLGSINQVNLK